MHIYANRFIGTALFFATIILLGTLGYMGIEGWSAGDSLYMTVITLTAVGYDEVHPLSPAGRIFTSFILAGGITGLGLWFAFLTSFIVELDLTHVFRHKRTLREIKKMKNHIIVCGAGRTGGQVVEELTMAGETFVIIERDKEKVEQILEMLPDLRVVEGDATTDHYLEEAGIAEARASSRVSAQIPTTSSSASRHGTCGRTSRSWPGPMRKRRCRSCTEPEPTTW